MNNLIKKEFSKENNNFSNNKKKLQGIIFSRACCSLGILLFHYSCHSKFKLLFRTVNATYGFIFVTSFFCISGSVLYHNYPNINSIKTFYFKRWKSIFPSYYICFTYFFMKNVFNKHKLFYKGHWSKLLLTIFGLDGYFFYKINNYYLVGEWFLGAIIIIYALYPLFLLFINNNKDITFIFIIFFFYYLMYKTNIFIIYKDTNLTTCFSSFYVGTRIIRYKKYFFENHACLLFSILLFLFLSLVKVKSFIFFFQIQGFSFFIILVKIGKVLMTTRFKIIFMEINNLSYIIYLYHHQIINNILSLNNPTNSFTHIILILITLLLTIICSKIHLLVVNSIFKTNIFKKIESFFI